MQLLNGRTMVPLRFISENLGYLVNWQDSPRAIYISARQSLEPLGIYHVCLGDAASKVTETLGKPQRIDPDKHGYSWWIYNKDLKNYLQVAIKDKRVAAIYANGQGWQWQGIKRGTPLKELNSLYPAQQTFDLRYDDTIFTIKLTQDDLAEKRLVQLHNAVATIFLDLHRNSQVSSLLLADYENLLKRREFSMQYNPRTIDPPDISLPSLTATQLEQVARSTERQIFDLTNSARALNGLPPLAWHEQAAAVAREHSEEMVNYNYISHISAVTGLGPFDRLRKKGILFTGVGENIAAGYADALSAFEGWMNSRGHRQTILNEIYTHLGAGVYQNHYTQNFLVLP